LPYLFCDVDCDVTARTPSVNLLCLRFNILGWETH
jgi:hypothetical protein